MNYSIQTEGSTVTLRSYQPLGNGQFQNIRIGGFKGDGVSEVEFSKKLNSFKLNLPNDIFIKN